MPETKTKPKFGTWTSAEFPPPLNVSVIICREGQGISFEAYRIKKRNYHPDDYPGVFWTNSIWKGAPIDGITHWMPMPPPKRKTT